jgi:hypothetical protein
MTETFSMYPIVVALTRPRSFILECNMTRSGCFMQWHRVGQRLAMRSVRLSAVARERA